jgi:hypothetical protein
VPFLSQPTHFVTRVDPNIFDKIVWFHGNKCCFIGYNKLFLEQSSGTHFYQFRFPRLMLTILQPWKNISWYVWKAKFSWFYICHDICIDSSRCHGHHGTLTVWLHDVIDTDFIWALYPNMRCTILITTNSFYNMGGPSHLWQNCTILLKETLLCGLWYVIFRKISMDPLLPILVPLSEAWTSIAMKRKHSSIPCPKGKVLNVLHLPRHQHR